MSVGVVKFFNIQKGFGFIKPEDGGKDVFVHVSVVERSGLSGLGEGQRVVYEVERDRNGRDAVIRLSNA
jgi:CspA family cold shock protein